MRRRFQRRLSRRLHKESSSVRRALSGQSQPWRHRLHRRKPKHQQQDRFSLGARTGLRSQWPRRPLPSCHLGAGRLRRRWLLGSRNDTSGVRRRRMWRLRQQRVPRRRRRRRTRRRRRPRTHSLLELRGGISQQQLRRLRLWGRELQGTLLSNLAPLDFSQALSSAHPPSQGPSLATSQGPAVSTIPVSTLSQSHPATGAVG